MTNKALLNLEMLSTNTAGPEAAEIMKDAEKKFGFSPNMYGYMAVLPSLLTTYAKGYGAFALRPVFHRLSRK